MRLFAHAFCQSQHEVPVKVFQLNSKTDLEQGKSIKLPMVEVLDPKHPIFVWSVLLKYVTRFCLHLRNLPVFIVYIRKDLDASETSVLISNCLIRNIIITVNLHLL